MTNRSAGALALWRDDNGRACVEQRIEELKHDLAADGFCRQRVLRGGSWVYVASLARCAYRNSDAPGNANVYWGFRCVRGL